MFRCRCLSMWGMRGGKCLPSGKCSNDWKRRNGRLEPLRYFLLGEIPFVVILLIVTVVVSIYYAGQAHELPNNAIVGTDFNWYTGCADEYGLFSDTSSYHTLVTWSPFIVLFIIFGIGVPLRLSATSTWCNFCLSCIGGTRSAERFKVGRSIFTCMCALGAGLQFLLAPVLTFGWTSNVVCVENVTCAQAMVAAAQAATSNVPKTIQVCCSEYASDPEMQCNQATFRILFIVTASIFPFVLCLALTTALQEKAKFQGRKIGTGGQRLVSDDNNGSTNEVLEESELDSDNEEEGGEEEELEGETKI